MPDRIPFAVRLSFAPLVAALRARRRSAEAPEAALIEAALAAYDAAPDLARAEAHGGVPRDLAREHEGVARSLLHATAPDALLPGATLALVPPYSRWAATETPAWRALDLLGGTWDTLLDAGGPLGPAFGAEDAALGVAQSAYLLALRELADPDAIEATDHRADPTIPSVTPTRDAEGGLLRAFSIHADTRFCVARRTSASHGAIPAAVVRDLLAHRDDLSRWERAIPTESVVLEGVVLFRATEITREAARSALFATLARVAGPLRADLVAPFLRAYYGDPTLSVSLVALAPEARVATRAEVDLTRAPRAPEAPLVHRAARDARPLLLTDLDAAEVSPEERAAVSAYREAGARSLALVPVWRDGAPLAVLAVTSERAGAVHAFNVRVLSDAASAASDLLARRIAAEEDRLQSAVRRLYTALHPTVDWRFRQAARAHLDALARGDADAAPEVIRFPDVHALWGQADVRGSTALRLAAIRSDEGTGGRERLAAYEAGMSRLNAALASALTDAQPTAQREAPHVLRPTVTDGLEYDGFVGPSLVSEAASWNGPDALRRLWRWQVALHLALERAAQRAGVPDGLRVAHLLLFHADPLDVRFRTDELRLDVDGPAHAYVEVVKKRIEKAREAGEDGHPRPDRLSQPGHLTVVCSGRETVQDARRVLAAFVETGALSEPASVRIEPLNGVGEITALRCRFGPRSPA